MKRRLLLLGVVPLAPLAFFGFSHVHAARRQPWNLVVISIDTLRADHLSAYGYERPTSPALARFAARGIVFENAYANAPKTAPSHMTLLTGLLPEAHGIHNLEEGESSALPTAIPTLASVLREHGYRTAALTAGGEVVPELGFDRGQDTFEVCDGAPHIFERAEEKLVEFGKDPFCLFVHTYAVHDPYSPSEPYNTLWTDPAYRGRIPESADALMRAAGDDWTAKHDAFWKCVDRDSSADLAEIEALYDGSVRMVDDLLGHLLAKLEAMHKLERTLVVIVGDHGEEFREHGGFLHETLYQEVLHVPLVILPPDDGWMGRLSRLRGTRASGVVSLVDVLPTVLDVLDIDAPPNLQGRSVLRVASDTSDRTVLSAWPGSALHAVRHGEWKLVRHGAIEGRATREELFDLAADPRETEDVSPRHPAIRDELRRELDATSSESRALLARSGQKGPAIEMRDSVRRQLESLGYIGAQPGTR
jgi:arylsulfatase A-like enzyme